MRNALPSGPIQLSNVWDRGGKEIDYFMLMKPT
jgi:hypothetical protein